MKLYDWLSEHPYFPNTISADNSLVDILSIMLAPPFSRDIYVVSNEKHLIGHLSLKEIAHHLFPRYQPAQTRRQIIHRVAGGTVLDLMNTEFSYATPYEELEDILYLFLERDIEELPIVDEKATLLGGVKLTSILRYLVDKNKSEVLCKL